MNASCAGRASPEEEAERLAHAASRSFAGAASAPRGKRTHVEAFLPPNAAYLNRKNVAVKELTLPLAKGSIEGR